jgi:CxxC-x17-CxxC domain-containing protein
MTASNQFRQARDRLVDLLENIDSLEREWQALFTDFPFILTDCLALGIEPTQIIPCRPGKAEADFYFYPKEEDPLSAYGVVEIKRPKTAILKTPRRDVLTLSADATTAVAQAQKYAIELGAEIQRRRNQLLVMGNLHHIIVIAGMSSEIARKVTTDLLSKQFRRLLPPNCKLIPFDVLSESLASRTPPVIHVAVPWPADTPATPREPSRFAHFTFGPRPMHVVKCTECGKKAEVPFKPTPGKPVYCKDCYRRHARF